MKDKYFRLELKILKHIIQTEKPDYKTLEKELNRNRLTIRQSIQSLSKKQCITNEPINPTKEKSKLIFRPTIKGLVVGLGLLDIKFDQIKNNSQKVIDLTLYQQFKNNVGVDKLNEILKILSIWLIDYNFIDNNSKQLFSDAYSITKMFLRISLFSQLLNKDFDIENLLLLYSNEILYKQNVKDVVPSLSLIPLKTVLVKIRHNLQKTINLLSE